MTIFGWIIESEKSREADMSRQFYKGAYQARELWMNLEGYKPVINNNPPKDRPILVMREEWVSPHIDRADSWHPMMNIAGLYWKEAPRDSRQPPAAVSVQL